MGVGVGAVPLVALSHLRRNRGSSVLISILLALGIAMALAALAGARRTDAAIGKFVAADKAADVYAAFAGPALGGTASADLVAEEAQVQALDGVVRTGRVSEAIVQLTGPTIPGGRVTVGGWNIGMDPEGIGMISRFHLVAGTHPDQRRPEQVIIDEELARDTELAVGSHLKLRTFTPDQLSSYASAPAEGIEVDAQVVGVVRRPTDLRDPQQRQLHPNVYTVHQDLYMTSALWDMAGGNVASASPSLVAIDLAEGVNVGEFIARLTEETGAYAMAHDRFLEVDGTFKGVERSASVHAWGLRAFAAAVALATLFLVGQTLGRQIVLEALENNTLHALGMTSSQLLRSALLRAGPLAMAGSALGAVGAVALSPLAPLWGSVARRAELDPGISVDATVLVGGGLLATVLVTLAGVLPSTRAITTMRRERPSVGRPSIASRLAHYGLPAPAVVGVRFALEPGRERMAVPVRTALVTGVTAVAVVLAVGTFSTSLSESRSRSINYGVTWDVAAGAMSTPEEATAMANEVRKIPGIRAFAGMRATAFDTPYGEIPSMVLRQEKGLVTPLITSGSAPGPGEVALGAITMKELDLRIGDELPIVDQIAGSRNFRITGTAVLNVAGVDVSISPGRGALFDWSMLALLSPDAGEFVAPQIFLVEVEPGRVAEVEDQLRALFPTSTRSEPVEPFDLTNLGDASLLPRALGVVMAILGLGTVAHTLLSAVRRRQRELAVLKAVGFDRRQTRLVVICQALTFGAVALVVGLPLSVAAGRTAWTLAANELGIPSQPVTSFALMAIAAAALLVLLVLTALMPARLAARVSVSEVLRRD
ncbi:MAG TPA: FtsX-like permease family protein [Acidimicrobiales bacterium]|nr:FtsX-like permease family protein [Acidimicrobiales bacterium]